jgi:hypothetical protein
MLEQDTSGFKLIANPYIIAGIITVKNARAEPCGSAPLRLSFSISVVGMGLIISPRLPPNS